jgi:sugar lactone lactonase YvrE
MRNLLIRSLLATLCVSGITTIQAQSNYEPYSFTTFAGTAGTFGSTDGTASTARFAYPGGVAVDSVGNAYVADTDNSTIRKITSAGVVSTLAGLPGGNNGSADGTGSAARFHGPRGVAVDNAGNVYVADTVNNTIRKITPAGAVSTLAGLAGSVGSADGTGGAARFDYPHAVAADSAGNVYVADTENNTIRKITPAGVVTTLAGLPGSSGSSDGAGSAARFWGPQGVAVDSAGNIYVADTYNHTIRKITSAGLVTTLAGSEGFSGSEDGKGSVVRFYDPEGVAVDSMGNVYVADTYNQIIRKITPAGVVTTLAGLPGGSGVGSADGTGSAARFNYPHGIAVNSAGNVYVADTANHTIRVGGPTATQNYEPYLFSTFAGLSGSLGSANGTGSAARFNRPLGVAVDTADNVYVADSSNHTIRKITPGGVVSTLAGLAGLFGSADGTGAAARFYYPGGLAVDSAGIVYVADTYNHTIRKITPAGVVTTLAGSAGSIGSTDGTGNAARFAFPSGVAVDSAGYVYVGDTSNYTIRKITPAGVVSTLAGLAGSLSGSADGTGSAARFNFPDSVTVDSAGNVYVADSHNHTIRKITPAGVVSTLAGLPNSTGSADGMGSTARFNQPYGVAVDSAGNLYVADTNNDTIRKITSAGTVSTLAGFPSSSGSADGTGSGARFNQPFGVAVNGAGKVFVGDTFNHTIRVGGSTAVSHLGNISTRLQTGTGDNVLIAGFIIQGSAPKKVIIRAAGPSLMKFGVSNALINPRLELHDTNKTIGMNDDWQTTQIGGVITSDQVAEIQNSGLAPSDSAESAVIATLPPGNYTSIVTGVNGGTGIGIVEVYDLSATNGSLLANISTRGFIQTGDNVMIGGFIVVTQPTRVIVRAIGPSLTQLGVPNALANPQLELHDATSTIARNDDWQTTQIGGIITADQVTEIRNSQLAPSNSAEAAIITTLQPGSYTAIVQGLNGTTGVGLIEVYKLQ